MKSTYYDYLKSLDKDQIIELLYKPYSKYSEYPAISKRKVALRVSYHGENYKGVQHHKHLKTVHDCLQNALRILEIGDEMVFCGRTDAGVDAISMIVSVKMNSRLEHPNRWYKVVESDKMEYPYDVILNMMLPLDIRVTGWAPVPDNFNARYDCVQRHYKYFFILDGLDLIKMEEAKNKIAKMTNFYDFSTHSNPKAIYERSIDEITINKCDDAESVYYLDIKARGFLHNMVRKIFWVIENSGKGNNFVFKNGEIGSPIPLVFVGAKYSEELMFLKNKYSKAQFKKEAEISKIKAAIADLRLKMNE